MADHNSSEEKNKTFETPAPEVLHAKSDEVSRDPEPSKDALKAKIDRKPKHITYRPSHKATFIGVAVVVAILAVNTGAIAFIMNTQGTKTNSANGDQVVVSSAALDKLGVSRNPLGTVGTELVVGPNSKFNGTLTVAGDVSVAGQFKLNSKFSATDASLTKLAAGDTTVGQLNVSGDGTLSNLNLRKDFTVLGLSKLQGPVNVSQLLTVSNSVNITGNLSVGGVLSIGAFQTNTLTIGGHVITRGWAPSVSKGGALAGTDTVSISGNDASGTVAVNIGAGSRSGVLANISFNSNYTNTPHVVITSVGAGVSDVYVNRSAGGFSIGVSSIVSGGHAFDYIIMQ